MIKVVKELNTGKVKVDVSDLKDSTLWESFGYFDMLLKYALICTCKFYASNELNSMPKLLNY